MPLLRRPLAGYNVRQPERRLRTIAPFIQLALLAACGRCLGHSDSSNVTLAWASGHLKKLSGRVKSAQCSQCGN